MSSSVALSTKNSYDKVDTFYTSTHGSPGLGVTMHSAIDESSDRRTCTRAHVPIQDDYTHQEQERCKRTCEETNEFSLKQQVCQTRTEREMHW